MYKKSLFTALCLTALLFFPHNGMARMTALTDNQLNNVVGQAGINFNVDNLGFNMTMNTVYWGDKDGLGGQTGPGYISLCDVTIKGNVDFKEPLTMNVGTQMTSLGTEVQSMDVCLNDMSLDIDQFTIDAIRLGPNPGEGPSLGSFGIYDMHVEMTGAIQISVR